MSAETLLTSDVVGLTKPAAVSPVDPPNPLWPMSPTQLALEMKAPVLGLYGAEMQAWFKKYGVLELTRLKLAQNWTCARI